ncbi:MAG: glycosyltransferase family 39 protein [Spirochaetes bacterium]|nr:glycosyltransferase family 39 protein [Spirochaetota bacterium]
MPKNHSIKISSLFIPFLIWLILLPILLPGFNLGFDLSDEGWQLAKAWGMFHGDFSNNADLIWGSSFINGLWLNLKNEPSLLWSRTAFLVFLPFLGVLIFLILKEFFDIKYALLSVITAFLFFNKTFLIYSSVNYYYLPVAASLLSFLFLVRSYRSENPSIVYLVLSGIFAGVTIHLKFTYILIIPVIISYLFFFCRKEFRLKSSVYFFSALFLSLVGGFVVLIAFGGAEMMVYGHGRLSVFDMFGYFFGTSEVNSSLNYSYKNLLSIYFKDLISMLNFTMIPLLILSASSYLSKRWFKLTPLFILAAGTALYFFIFLNSSDSHLKFIGVFFALQTVIMLYFNNALKERFFLYFIFSSVFALSFLGSGTGFYGGIFSLGFFGFACLTLCTLSTDLPSDRFNTKVILPAFIVAALIIQIVKEYNPYRDLPSSYLNTEFKSPELSGIYSFKERVDAVDEFMDYAKSGQINVDRVIIVGMPVFYYLLDINPIISETHDVILGFEQLKKEVIEANPNVIVMPVQSPRGNLWPLPQNADYWTRDGFERQTARYYEFYREYMRVNNFNKEFENAMFAVYRKGELLREATE